MTEERGHLGWVLVVSLAAHVAIVRVVPGEPRPPRLFVPPIELAELPPPAEPEPPPAEPEPEPEPAAARAEAPRTSAAPKVLRPQVSEASASAGPRIDDVVDFTDAPLSNAAPVGEAGAGTGPSSGAPSAPRVASAPTFVPAASLSRPPRAPSLDAELERSYPPEARRAGISGKAVLRVAILADGRVGKVARVSETYAGFGEACERTVRSARWEPPLDRDGRPVATEITYVCRFEVRS